MFRQTFILAVFLVGANCRYLLVEEPFQVGDYFVPREIGPDLELVQHPVYSPRVRRQAQTSISVDGKTGNAELSAKIPIARSDSNILSLTGSQGTNSRGLGFTVDNINGHALSVSQKAIPEFGNQLTAAGKLNVLHTDRHNVDANAFLTKNMPNKFPGVSNFNTYGGNIDYTFNDKIGASLGAARTDFLQRTDVNALGHLNLFKNKDSSFDFNAGATRSFSPFIPRSSWEPTFGFSFSKTW
ncbi:attacin-A-like [Epargyreus clarus]|uniref:attacin-A-like n=1 Tax=Epargyreus clarus TaxID=520877 RepID=UPI003C2E68F8